MSNRRRRLWINTLMIAAAAVVALALWLNPSAPGRRSDGSDNSAPIGFRQVAPVDEGRKENEPEQNRPTIAHIEESLEDTEDMIARMEWERADQEIERLRRRWLAFRPGMRTFAGEEAWSTQDVNTFEASLTQLQRSIARRNSKEANERLETMKTLVETYKDRRAEPYNRPPRPARRPQGSVSG